MKKSIFASLLAAICVSATAAQYYVVVPVPKRAATAGNIMVALNGYSLPAAFVGRAYTAFDFNSLLQVRGDPDFNADNVRWSVASGALPAGMTLSAYGQLSGTPSVPATSAFQLVASYKTKTGQQGYQLVVGQVVAVLGQATLPDGVQGAAYSFDFTPSLSVTGDAEFLTGAVTWAALSGVPAGMQLTSSGVMTGTPSVGGVSTVQVQANYRGTVATRTYPLTIRALAPDFRLAGTPGLSYDFTTRTVGTEGTQTVIAVSNAGTAAGTLAVPAFSGANPQDFASVSTCATVAPAANCEVRVSFKPTAAGNRTAVLTLAGSTFTFAGTGLLAPRQYVVLTAGSAYQIPAGVNVMTAWAVGGGGGGAGGPVGQWGSAGGGGGAGGLAYSSFAVSPGGTLSYTIGARGTGGVGAQAGTAGGQTSGTYQAVVLTAAGGTGGYFNTNQTAPGGTATGGDSFAGGIGQAGTQSQGAGAGGGIAGGVGGSKGSYGYNGAAGAQAIYPKGLSAAILAAGLQLGAPGAGAQDINAINPGGNATGFGHGGGGAAIWGGGGGNGALGGGGGGATGSYDVTSRGGYGGAGFIVLQLN